MLDRHLYEHLYLTANEVADSVGHHTWGVIYSESGINQLLRRMAMYTKSRNRFLVRLIQDEDLKSNKATEELVYFMGATHSHHNVVVC